MEIRDSPAGGDPLDRDFAKWRFINLYIDSFSHGDTGFTRRGDPLDRAFAKGRFIN
jgi:hypothetical protein